METTGYGAVRFVWVSFKKKDEGSHEIVRVSCIYECVYLFLTIKEFQEETVDTRRRYWLVLVYKACFFLPTRP
jgi:hypothetical protein